MGEVGGLDGVGGAREIGPFGGLEMDLDGLANGASVAMEGGLDLYWLTEVRMGRTVLFECLDGFGPAALVVESIADADAVRGVG